MPAFCAKHNAGRVQDNCRELTGEKAEVLGPKELYGSPEKFGFYQQRR